MLETLFAEVWTQGYPVHARQAHPAVLGMIAAQGESATFKIQTKAGCQEW